MTKYNVLALTTKYWKPKENYLDNIINAVKDKVENDDFVVVSEKAISTATGNIIDESKIDPTFTSKILARLWMRIFWGYFLGTLCRFGSRLINRLRNYPLETGSRHKQTALQYAGFLQALLFGSEGGIDGSNLPYSYVSLPLKNADEHAKKIRQHIKLNLKKNVNVIIVDTDKTYRFRNFYFTPRPNPMKGIHSFGGTILYLTGRVLKLKKSSTPLATSGCKIDLKKALQIANIADKARGQGSGATVWDMASRFHVQVDGVSWEMLAEIKHKPLALVRELQANKSI